MRSQIRIDRLDRLEKRCRLGTSVCLLKTKFDGVTPAHLENARWHQKFSVKFSVKFRNLFPLKNDVNASTSQEFRKIWSEPACVDGPAGLPNAHACVKWQVVLCARCRSVPFMRGQSVACCYLQPFPVFPVSAWVLFLKLFSKLVHQHAGVCLALRPSGHCAVSGSLRSDWSKRYLNIRKMFSLYEWQEFGVSECARKARTRSLEIEAGWCVK